MDSNDDNTRRREGQEEDHGDAHEVPHREGEVVVTSPPLVLTHIAKELSIREGFQVFLNLRNSLKMH